MIGALDGLAAALSRMALAIGGEAVITCELTTNDPARALGVVARGDEPVVVLIGDDVYELPSWSGDRLPTGPRRIDVPPVPPGVRQGSPLPRYSATSAEAASGIAEEPVPAPPAPPTTDRRRAFRGIRGAERRVPAQALAAAGVVLVSSWALVTWSIGSAQDSREQAQQLEVVSSNATTLADLSRVFDAGTTSRCSSRASTPRSATTGRSSPRSTVCRRTPRSTASGARSTRSSPRA
ncbi:MAG: hypothetical protein PGN13_06745 [Patulibacter minatonensis]